MEGNSFPWRYVGGIIAVLVFLYLISSIHSTWLAMEEDLRLALTLIFFVWILNWARKNLGSPRLAIIFAIVIAYLVFFKHPEVIWWIFGAIILTTFGAKIIENLGPSGPDKGKALDAYKEAKPMIVINTGQGTEAGMIYSAPPERRDRR